LLPAIIPSFATSNYTSFFPFLFPFHLGADIESDNNLVPFPSGFLVWGAMSDTGYNGGRCGVGSAEFGRLNFANYLGVFLSFFLGSHFCFFVLLASAWLEPGCTVGEKKRATGFSRHHFYGKGLRCYGFCLLLGLAGGGGCQYIVFFPRYPLFLFLFTFASREYLFLCLFSFMGFLLGNRILV